MTAPDRKRSLTPGITLILIGLWILLGNRLHDIVLWERIYPILILVLGLSLLADASFRRRTGPLFWGVFVICTGVFFLLRTYDVIPYMFFHEYWPLSLVSAGFGMAAVYVIYPHVMYRLILAVLFGLTGLALFSHTAYGVVNVIPPTEWIWPAVLMAGGLALIVRGWRSSV